MEIDSPSVESRGVTARGHRIHYLRAGSGPAVVLVHGGASDSRDWLGTMSALAGRFTLYAPDLIGFGQSQRRQEGYYLADFIEFLEEFIDTLGLEKPSLVGHSFGARLALGVALSRPDKVDKLILTDAAGLGKVSKLGEVVFTAFYRLRRLFGRPQPHPTFLARDGEDPDWACVADLPKIQSPTLIIWKRRDPYLPVANAHRAVTLIPDARLELLPGIGHAPHQSNADAFNRIVGEFLGEGPAGT